MKAEPRIQRAYRVRFDEAGPEGNLRSSGYLRYAQDLAWIHSEGAGFGRDWYTARGLTWLVRSVELDILSDVAYGDELVVSTQVIGFRRVLARRRTDFHGPGSERPAAVAITDWILINARGLPARVPDEIATAFAQPESSFAPLRLQTLPIPDEAVAREVSVRRSELDPMAHVNNAAYIDYMDEHFLNGPQSRATLPAPRRYRADFVASAEPNSTLVVHGWESGPAWHCRLEDAAGHAMLRARLELDPATWVGG